MRRPAPGLRVFLNAVAVGVLVFLLWDVLSAAWEPIDSALGDIHEHQGGLSRAIGYGALFAGGLAVGLLSLLYYEQWMARRAKRPPTRFAPGAMLADEVAVRTAPDTASAAR